VKEHVNQHRREVEEFQVEELLEELMLEFKILLLLKLQQLLLKITNRQHSTADKQLC